MLMMNRTYFYLLIKFQAENQKNKKTSNINLVWETLSSWLVLYHIRNLDRILLHLICFLLKEQMDQQNLTEIWKMF